jgi:hypothetical protein
MVRRSLDAVRAFRAQAEGRAISVQQQQELATAAHVGLRTIYAANVILDLATPMLLAAVERGQVSMSRAALVVRLPDAEQDVFVQLPPAEATLRYRQLCATRPPRQSQRVKLIAQEDIPNMPSMLEETDRKAAPQRRLTARRREVAQQTVAELTGRLDCHDVIMQSVMIGRLGADLLLLIDDITDPKMQPVIVATKELCALVAAHAAKSRIRIKVQQIAELFSAAVPRNTSEGVPDAPEN